jgi:riboflavin kinase/FMN adenylyltransferase
VTSDPPPSSGYAPAALPPEIWRGSGPAPASLAGSVVAIGNFDGVHLGHKALIAEAMALGRRAGVGAALVTFEPHPRTVFRPEHPVFRLTPPDLRAILAGECGVSAIAEMQFDRAFAAQPAMAFIEDLLIGRLGAAGVVVGSDFAFGRGREGDAALLRREFEARGRPVSVLEPVLSADGAPISSSRIRAALEAGDAALADALLGHRWRVRAEIVHGDKRGRLLGYPTANMLLSPDCRLRHGIYAVRMRLGGAPEGAAWLPGVASFGSRPTFDDGAPRLETFLFDFSGDLYGRTAEIEFAGWIRGEEKFADMEALMVQMDRDSAEARAILGCAPGESKQG